MNNKPIANLRTFSHYSIGESIIKISDLINFAKENKYKYVALADRMNLFGAYEFVSEAIKAGIKPLLGCVIKVEKIGYVTIYIQNRIGYESFSKILSDCYIKDLDHILIEDLQKIQYCICLAGKEMNVNNIEHSFNILNKIFPNSLYVELQNKNLELYQIAHKMNLPLVYAKDAYYLQEDDLEKFYVFQMSHQKLRYDQDAFNSMEPDNQLNFKNFLPEDDEGLINIEHIAKKCNFNFRKSSLLLPKYSNDENEIVNQLVYKGLEQKVKFINDEQKQRYLQRLEYELNVLKSKNYIGYFLITADFIRYAKDSNIPVGPGRGSAAGSLVSYCLDITDVDPIQFNLLFERFLNPERSAAPDIDIDFCPEGREKVKQYLIDKYGAYNIANIITFGKLHARGAVKDVFRVMKISYLQADAICKNIPQDQINPVALSQAVKNVPGVQKFYKDPKYKKYIDIAISLEGIVRNQSVHAAGIVICNEPIFKYCPLIRSEAQLVTQFDMKSIDAIGCIKFDFLGLRTLTILAKTIELTKLHGKDIVDINKIPYDDVKTFEIINNLFLEGVFQFENSGIRDVISKTKIKSIHDLIALNALWRPGPIKNVGSYFARSDGKEKVIYLHERLKPILSNTYGIFVYQEQVMEAARQLADYSFAEADLLRRAMGKKIHKEMQAHRKKFVNNSVKKDISEDIANAIFDDMQEFSGYGFNKSHSTPYSIIAYQCAYLKAHYFIEFITTCLNFEHQDAVKTVSFMQEAKKMNIEILPPCINKSKYNFTIENGCIRYGLKALKNIGGPSGNMFEKNAPYKNIHEFVFKNTSVINQKNWDSLIGSGALDVLLPSDRKNFIQSDGKIVSYENGLEGSELHRQVQQNNQASTLQILKVELVYFGFYFHSPAKHLHKFLHNTLNNDIKKLDKMIENINLFGEIILVNKKIRNNRNYAFIKLLDHTEILDLTIFGDVLDDNTNKIKVGSLIYIKCIVQKNTNRINVNKILLIEEYLKTIISINISNLKIKQIQDIKTIIEPYNQTTNPKGRQIKLILEEEDLIITDHVNINADLLIELSKYDDRLTFTMN